MGYGFIDINLYQIFANIFSTSFIFTSINKPLTDNSQIGYTIRLSQKVEKNKSENKSHPIKDNLKKGKITKKTIES